MRQDYLTFTELQEANMARMAERGATLESMSLLEWAGAMCGEAGEAANVAKKIIRERDVAGNFKANKTMEERLVHFMDELADTVIYADLAAQAAGFSLDYFIIKKFNATSDKHGDKTKLETY